MPHAAQHLDDSYGGGQDDERQPIGVGILSNLMGCAQDSLAPPLQGSIHGLIVKQRPHLDARG